MKDIRLFGLRTQLAIVTAFLFVFALGLGGTLVYRHRVVDALAAEIKADLAIAVKLPKLKSSLRSLDLATAEFLRTGNALWLGERGQILEQISRTQSELRRLINTDRERAILNELDHQLKVQFEVEKEWVRRKQSKHLSAADAALMITSRRTYEDVLEIAMTMHDSGLETLAMRAREAQRRNQEGIWIIFIVGLFAVFILSWSLWLAIIAPIRKLADYAENWQPGQIWDCVIPSASPEIRSLFKRMQDLGDRLNAELRKEKELNHLKSQLVSTVSHDLNNALSVIHAASVNLEESEAKPISDKRLRMFRMIKGQAMSLSRTVANLLNLGRLQSGRLSLMKKQIDISAKVREAVDLMEVLFENKGLSVQVSVPDKPVLVYADPEALTLVLTNLVSNAIKYTPEGGRIEVGCGQEDVKQTHVCVYVKDSGIGIFPEERQKIFGGYYRAENGKKFARGFGIGLSTSRNIIEAHGGVIKLDSEPGKGSTFSFTLPAWVEDGVHSSTVTALEVGSLDH